MADDQIETVIEITSETESDMFQRLESDFHTNEVTATMAEWAIEQTIEICAVVEVLKMYRHRMIDAGYGDDDVSNTLGLIMARIWPQEIVLTPMDLSEFTEENDDDDDDDE